MQTLDVRALAVLLAEAGSAHGAYEERELGGVYDEQWPQWYSAYLVAHGIGELLGASLSAERVAAWLRACDASYRAEQPAVGWVEFYAAHAEHLSE